jgi:hypothetical protein
MSRRGRPGWARRPPEQEYESPYPECRITATVDPTGFVRLDVSRERAALLARHFNDRVEEHDGDGLQDVVFTMPRRAYEQLSDTVGRLAGPGQGAVQVVVDEDPDISIAVLLNESQVRGLDRSSSEALEVTPEQSTYGWEISVDNNGLDMLVKQLVAAIKGAEDPLEEVEP